MIRNQRKNKIKQQFTLKTSSIIVNSILIIYYIRNMMMQTKKMETIYQWIPQKIELKEIQVKT